MSTKAAGLSLARSIREPRGRKIKMTRAATFTQAQVRRAIKAVESAGLNVKRVIVRPDGSIVVESGETEIEAIDKGGIALATSWDDV
jgi:hypothetical protein